MTKTIYISVDVEADGPCPGLNSMLSVGAAAFTEDGTMLSTFSRNLETLPDAHPDSKTAEWWQTQPEAWKACREGTVDPGQAMQDLVKWAEAQGSHLVFVAYPAGFDFTYVYWYLHKFVGRSPFSFSALDMKTMTMCLLNTEYFLSTKKYMPRSWFTKKRHNHVAVDDAIEQGELFINMLKELRHGRKS